MEDAIVVPLKPISRELSGQMDTETMLLMLLNQDAMLIQYQPSSTTQHQSSNGTNLVAQSAGSFAKAVSLATQQIGHVASDSGLYRVILPAGFTVKDLVPAVGGGFRGDHACHWVLRHCESCATNSRNRSCRGGRTNDRYCSLGHGG